MQTYVHNSGIHQFATCNGLGICLGVPCVPWRPWRAVCLGVPCRHPWRWHPWHPVPLPWRPVPVNRRRHPWKIKRHPMPLTWRALSASLAAASFRTAAALAACALRCIKKAAAFIKRLKNVHNTYGGLCLIRKGQRSKYYRPTDARPPTAAALRSCLCGGGINGILCGGILGGLVGGILGGINGGLGGGLCLCGVGGGIL